MANKPHDQLIDFILGLGISEEHFLKNIGLSQDLLKTNGSETARLEKILNLFDELKVMFHSDEEAWNWFINHKIIGFGNVTASQIIVENYDSGIAAIIDYIKCKKLAGFE